MRGKIRDVLGSEGIRDLEVGHRICVTQVENQFELVIHI